MKNGESSPLATVLRGVSHVIAGQLAPEVSSALAKDAATFGAGLLRGLLLQEGALRRVAEYESALRDLTGHSSDNAASRHEIGAWVESLYLLQDVIDNRSRQTLAAVVREEQRLQAGIRADDESENERAKRAAAVSEEIVNPATVAAYLGRRFGRSDIVVTDLRVIPGGGSKITRAISLAPIANLPAELIMRQDYAVNHVGNSIADEYPFLETLHKVGLPVAAPILLEPTRSSLGAPFMLVEKVKGQNIGNLWGFFPGSEPKDVCLQLACVLAKIHNLPLDAVRIWAGRAGDTLRAMVLHQIDEIHGKWQQGRSTVSPVIGLALLWLKENLDTETARPGLVHGDCAFTNILVHEGQISALLDWEFAHIGDPAEDLAYIRGVVAQVMPWQDFVGAYCAAGGTAPSTARLDYFDVWRALRNAVYAGLAGESFLRGDTSYLMLGWAGIYAQPMLEHQLIEMIGDAWKRA